MDLVCLFGGAAIIFGPLIIVLIQASRQNQNQRELQILRTDLRKLSGDIRNLKSLLSATHPELAVPPEETRSTPSPVATDAPPAPETSAEPSVPPLRLTIQRHEPFPRDPSGSPRVTLEETIGSKWLAWFGGLVALFAVALALKYASEQGWINAQSRSLAAALVGIALVPYGMRLSSTRYRNLGQSLSATGLVVLMVDIMVAHLVHGFIRSPVLALALILVPIAAVWWLTARWKSMGMHALGLLAGLAAPGVIGFSMANAGWMLSFGTLMSLVALALAIKLDFRLSIPLTAIASAVFCAFAVPVAVRADLVVESQLVVTALMLAFISIARPTASPDSRHVSGIDVRSAAAILALILLPLPILNCDTRDDLLSKSFAPVIVGFLLGAWFVLPYCITVGRFIVGMTLTFEFGAHLAELHRHYGLSDVDQSAYLLILAGTFLAALIDARKRSTQPEVTEPGLLRNVGSAFMLLPFAYALLQRQLQTDAINVVVLPIAALLFALAVRWFQALILIPAFTVCHVAAYFMWASNSPWSNASPSTYIFAAITSAMSLALCVLLVPRGGLIPRLAWVTSSVVYFALSPVIITTLRVLRPEIPTWIIPLVVDIPGLILLFIVYRNAPRTSEADRAIRGTIMACGILALFLLANATTQLAFQPGSRAVYVGLIESGPLQDPSSHYESSFAAEACRSFVWAAFGFTLVLIGFLRKNTPIRRGGLLLLGMTFAKCAFVDVWELGGLWRIAALAGLSLALFLAAYLYQRFLRPLVTEPNATPSAA